MKTDHQKSEEDYRYKAEIIQLLFSDIEDIIDYDWNALVNRGESLLQKEEKGATRTREKCLSSPKC